MTLLAAAARLIRKTTGTQPVTDEAQAAYITHLHHQLEEAYAQGWALLAYTQHDPAAEPVAQRTHQYLDQIEATIGPSKATEIYNTIIN